MRIHSTTKPLAFAAVAGLAAIVPCRADAQATKATVLVRGAHCDACVAAVRKQVAGLEGVKAPLEDINKGERPQYFSAPFHVQLGSRLETGLGALGKAVAEAPTPHRDDLPPRLHLVLYTQDQIDEPSVMALRAALRDVNGVVVDEPGSLGGRPQLGWYWVQIEPAGGADLEAVLAAAKKAVDVTLTKP